MNSSYADVTKRTKGTRQTILFDAFFYRESVPSAYRFDQVYHAVLLIKTPGFYAIFSTIESNCSDSPTSQAYRVVQSTDIGNDDLPCSGRVNDGSLSPEQEHLKSRLVRFLIVRVELQQKGHLISRGEV